MPFAEDMLGLHLMVYVERVDARPMSQHLYVQTEDHDWSGDPQHTHTFFFLRGRHVSHTVSCV